LANDPCELKNEIGNPEYHAAFEMLKRKLHAKLVELGDSDPIVTEISLVKTKDKHSKKKDVKH
jgi:hypothetical protein